MWEVQFVLKLDTNTIIAQLQRAATDLSEVLITQWIAWIQLFDFEVRHVLRKRHTVVNRLSRWSKVEREVNDTEDIDKFIDTKLNVIRILTLEAEKKVNILKSEYSHESQQIAYFLLIMKKLKDISASDYFRFHKKVMRFLVQKSHLFCC